MDNEKFQELVLKQLQILTEGQKSFENRQESFEKRQESFENRQESFEKRQESFEKTLESLEDGQKNIAEDLNILKNRFTMFENDIMPKINALFDGWKQHNDQLNRIEEQVSKHEEFIIKRIK